MTEGCNGVGLNRCVLQFNREGRLGQMAAQLANQVYTLKLFAPICCWFF